VTVVPEKDVPPLPPSTLLSIVRSWGYNKDEREGVKETGRWRRMARRRSAKKLRE